MSSNGLTAPDSVMGSVGYIAPEQIVDSADPDVRGDLYAVGYTLVYAATGRAKGEGTPQSMLAQATAAPVRLDEALPDAPEGFLQLVADLTAAAPKARPPSAAAARERFERLQAAR